MAKISEYSIRPLTQEDEPFLWEILYEATHIAELHAIRSEFSAT